MVLMRSGQRYAGAGRDSRAKVSPASTPELEAHLADCPPCARFRQEMRIFDADLRRAVQKPPVLGAAIEYLPYLDRGDVNGTD
jgi:hypothetical protein